MKQILGHDVDLKELLNKIIDSFKKYYAAIENGEYAAISELYHSGIYRAHGFHRYKDKDGEFEAAIVEVEDSGNLILRDRRMHKVLRIQRGGFLTKHPQRRGYLIRQTFLFFLS